MVEIAVDLGYGYTKALSQYGNRTVFPSVVGRGFQRFTDQPLAREEQPRYEVRLNGESYFVGDLALRECWDAVRAFDEDRIKHFSTPVLFGTAAGLVAGEARISLSTGLPLELYRAQKNEFKNVLCSFNEQVEVLGFVPERKIQFEEVRVYPQACGAFYSYILELNGEPSAEGASLLEEGSLVGVLDVGYKTTDFVLMDLSRLQPIKPMSGTLNVGMSDLYRDVQIALQEETGDVLDNLKVEEAVHRGKLWLKGKAYSVSGHLRTAKSVLARTIADRLQNAWRDRTKYIRMVLLAGGGASFLGDELRIPDTAVRVLPDAQFANTLGFLAATVFQKKRALAGTCHGSEAKMPARDHDDTCVVPR